MQKPEQHIIKDDRFTDWCVKARNLYNQSLYYWRQSIFGNIQYFSEYELMKLMAKHNEENFRALPANTSQQIIKFLFKNIKSWQKARKEYAKNPSKFSGKPKMPNYKKSLSELYFTYNQVSVKDGFVHFPKKLGIKPMKTKIKRIDFCRIVPKSNHFIVDFVYTVEDVQKKEYNDKWMGIDIGLNNLATCSSNVVEPFIINGKSLKAVNNFYNKRKKQLQSKLKENIFTSKRIERLTFRRNQKIKDYIHKSSRRIVDLAKENDITKIIIGKNENWKQSINLGRKTNRQFTSIPHATLIEKIKYKAHLEGIEVIVTQEAYTSKCSAIDLEKIGKHESYVGKRKKRGLFITANGKLINADVNGSLNIARLVLGDGIIKHDSIMSCMVQPVKINNFNKQKNIKLQDLV
jgi:putative transposase